MIILKKSITFKDLEPKLKDRERFNEIKKAYKYAEKEHDGMQRLTGEAFITHPLEVTNILILRPLFSAMIFDIAIGIAIGAIASNRE